MDMLAWGGVSMRVISAPVEFTILTVDGVAPTSMTDEPAINSASALPTLDT